MRSRRLEEFAKRARTEKDPEKTRAIQELMTHTLWQEQKHAKDKIQSRLNRRFNNMQSGLKSSNS